MKRIIEMLNKTQFGFLANIENGKPRVRPFQFQFEKERKFYFCTSKDKNVYHQLIRLWTEKEKFSFFVNIIILFDMFSKSYK